MSPICVAGMHRSGTSMVTHVLHAAGVDLGPGEMLKPAADDNPDGYWEHEGFVAMNQQLLEALGGGWDDPPPADAQLADPERAAWRREAAALVAGFGGRPWAWKDPRNSLTLPFWQEVIDDLRVLVVVRHPAEVVASLRRRNGCSRSLSLSLWAEYSARLLASTGPGQRIVSHYDTWFDDARGETKRILTGLGLDVDDDDIAGAAAVVSPAIRHHRAGTARTDAEPLPREVAELYEWLCEEAQVVVGHPSPRRRGVRPTARRWAGAESLVAALEARDAERTALAAALEDARAEAATALEDSLRATSALADARLAHRDAVLDALAAERARSAQLVALLGHALGAAPPGPPPPEAPLAPMAAPAGGMAQEVARLTATVTDLRAEIQGALAREAEERACAESVERTRALIVEATPAGAVVAVASRGDHRLVALPGRRGMHFPASPDGQHAGFHPGDDLAAIALVEMARAGGAAVLAFPATELWWLDHYRGLRSHLERHHRLLVGDADGGSVWSLTQGPSARMAAVTQVGDALAALEHEWGRSPGLLDLGSGLDLTDHLASWSVFDPPASPDGALPLFDGSVDLVVVGDADPAALHEARRVAASAVAIVASGGSVTWEWKAEVPQPLPSVSIVIPCHDGAAMTTACVTAVLATVDRGLDVEVIVVDDASADRTDLSLAPMAAVDARLRVVRNERNVGYLESCNAGVATAHGEVIVLLNNDTVPLPGWLPPLLRTLGDETIGIAGGKLVYPDGTLQEAGGVVFADGRGANFGKGSPTPGAALFSYLRDVDFCSGALLAIRRALFLDVGGLDTRYRPAYYEDVDLCFTVEATGRRVVFQPASVVVHLEGMSSGTDLGSGVKRHQVVNREVFVDKWHSRLEGQPVHPGQFDELTWLSLSVGGR